MTGSEARQKFLDFFAGHDHTIKPSYPLVPPNDPTLLFTSAGMVQFKSELLGEVDLTYTRAATAQKCFRTSDIEEVGRTARHLTFFEMLGNFSFGDYFKAEACAWGWEYITQVIGIPVKRLHVSIYKDDDEAFEIWKQIGVKADRITRLGDEDNFWTMGPTGPCGPCSEIFYDYGPKVGCRRKTCAVGCDCDRYVEIWNLVFTQFDRQEDGSLVDLPRKNIDTGMGLERLVSVIQGKLTNFETDLLFPIIEAAQELTGIPYKDNLTAYRVLADHARAITFVMADGVLPSNEGRGYVVRRILRRAVKYGRDLGLTDPFLHALSGTVVDLYGDHYTELRTQHAQIARLIEGEEERFQATLATGLTMLTSIIDATAGSEISGADAFRLYDTYGFPVDLTRDVAADHGKTVDQAGFDAAMEEQRERARAADSRYEDVEAQRVYLDLLKELGPTEFLGYEAVEAEGTVVALLQAGGRVDTAQAGTEAEVILDRTPCYAEAGGQIADQGTMRARNSQATATVGTVQAPVAGLTVHRVTVDKGTLRVGDVLHVAVPADVRQATAIHHSATHILHAALREVLGEHVSQAGSYVGPDRLRFDYTHFAAPSAEQGARVETLVNDRIRQAVEVRTTVRPIAEAKAAGAMALFGEKYGEMVRVVEMGDFSTELCGGTHLHNTGEIGTFHVLSDSSIAAGTRRLEAVCGPHATAHIAAGRQTLADAATALNVPAAEVAGRVRQLLDERRQLEKQLAGASRKQAAARASDVLDQVQDVGGVPLLAAVLEGLDSAALLEASDALRRKLPDGILVLGSATNGKVGLLCAVSPSLTDRIKAGEIIKPLAKMVGGGGGGKAELAQAGGKRAEALPDAIAAAAGIVAELLGR